MDRTWKALVAAGLALGAAAVLSCLVLAYSIRGADQAAREAAEREREEAERVRRAQEAVEGIANSEGGLVHQATRALNAGDLAKAEDLYRRCIEQYDSDVAKVLFARMLANAKDYDRLFLLERNLVLSSQGELRKMAQIALTDVLAKAHREAASQAFNAGDWKAAEREFVLAWRLHGETGVGFECLRNACAAASNDRNLTRVQELVALYAASADSNDEGLAEVQRMLDKLRQLEAQRSR